MSWPCPKPPCLLPLLDNECGTHSYRSDTLSKWPLSKSWHPHPYIQGARCHGARRGMLLLCPSAVNLPAVWLHAIHLTALCCTNLAELLLAVSWTHSCRPACCCCLWIPVACPSWTLLSPQSHPLFSGGQANSRGLFSLAWNARQSPAWPLHCPSGSWHPRHCLACNTETFTHTKHSCVSMHMCIFIHIHTCACMHTHLHMRRLHAGILNVPNLRPLTLPILILHTLSGAGSASKSPREEVPTALGTLGRCPQSLCCCALHGGTRTLSSPPWPPALVLCPVLGFCFSPSPACSHFWEGTPFVWP